MPVHSNDLRYWANSEHFSYLKGLVERGDIQAISMNLNDSKQVQKLVSEIKKSELSISVLDFSNVWGVEFMRQFEERVRPFFSDAPGEALLLLTWMRNKLFGGDIEYVATTMRVAKRSKWSIKFLHKVLIELLEEGEFYRVADHWRGEYQKEVLAAFVDTKSLCVRELLEEVLNQ